MTFSRDSMAANKVAPPTFLDEHLKELTQIDNYIARSAEKLRRLMKEGVASRDASLNNTKECPNCGKCSINKENTTHHTTV